jgi:hypothetical protein
VSSALHLRPWVGCSASTMHRLQQSLPLSGCHNRGRAGIVGLICSHNDSEQTDSPWVLYQLGVITGYAIVGTFFIFNFFSQHQRIITNVGPSPRLPRTPPQPLASFKAGNDRGPALVMLECPCNAHNAKRSARGAGGTPAGGQCGPATLLHGPCEGSRGEYIH